MTTEDEFQAMLDANLDDWQTRLVFADWLDERGDPRAEGYRALGLSEKEPLFLDDGVLSWHWYNEAIYRGHWDALPQQWFRLMVRKHKRSKYYRSYHTRREAEDAAALAFAKLPAARRAELLTTQPV